MGTIEFTDEEKDLISKYSIKGGWESPAVADLKEKIKKFLRDREIALCCYCRTAMHGWHKLTIDPEHVLPKTHYPKYVFTLLNLNISCKRCNMQIKGDDDSFFADTRDCVAPFKSELYKFIHPNLDDADQHLSIELKQFNGNLMRKYWVLNESEKGKETYRYFGLEELEVNTFDRAQGLSPVSPDMPPPIARELTMVLDEQTNNT